MSDLNDKTDEELLQLSGNKDSVGKREVLSLLLDRHYNWIFKMCLAHLKHTQTAEDCAQGNRNTSCKVST